MPRLLIFWFSILWSSMVGHNLADTLYKTINLNLIIKDHLTNIEDPAQCGTRAVVVADNSCSGPTYEAQYDYYPYGKILRKQEAPRSRFQSTDHETDLETGYNNRNARWYDNESFSFLGCDPMQTTYPSWSPYHYVGRNPIRLIDPSGKVIEVAYFEDGKKVGETYTYKDGELYDKNGKKYDRSNAYINNVLNTLNDLYNVDERVKQVVTDLQNDNKVHIITNYDVKFKLDPKFFGSYSRNSTDETNKGGSLIKFNPQQDKVKGNFFSNMQNLGHEMKHSWNRITGNTNLIIGPHEISYEEIDAINFQNIIADKEKLQLRTTYGNRPIPCDEIIMPFFYKLQSNKR